MGKKWYDDEYDDEDREREQRKRDRRNQRKNSHRKMTYEDGQSGEEDDYEN